jgi:acyl-CoA synthetase (AMP-forming)/AMP-acid ligase II
MRSLNSRLREVVSRGGLATVNGEGETLSTEQLLGSELTMLGEPSSGRRIAICLNSSIDFIRVIFALDGVASSLLLISPSLHRDDALSLMDEAECDGIVTDCDSLSDRATQWRFQEKHLAPVALHSTKWLMTTSGTTGRPKIIPHSLDSLTASVTSGPPNNRATWGLLYESSRFAGVQVILHALLGGGALLTVDRNTTFPIQVEQLKAGGCTHLSATATMWRKLLMLPSACELPLRQITLGGDIADERTLTALSAAFPKARITHVYASTEIGAAFSVHDGKAGFPLNYLQTSEGRLQLKVQDGLLWIKPPKRGFEYPRRDADGFACTGDCVEISGDRVFFAGRVDTVANVGGTKVSMERVEALVREHPEVLDCRVIAKSNPIVGSILTMQVVARGFAANPAVLQNELRNWCRQQLPREAWPALITIVPDLPQNAAGKLARVQ